MATAVARRQSRPKRAAPEIPVASGWFWFAAAMVGAMVVIPFYLASAEDFRKARRIVAEATTTRGPGPDGST